MEKKKNAPSPSKLLDCLEKAMEKKTEGKEDEC